MFVNRCRLPAGTYQHLKFLLQSLFHVTDFTHVLLKFAECELFPLQLFGNATSLPYSYVVQKQMNKNKIIMRNKQKKFKTQKIYEKQIQPNTTERDNGGG